LIVCAVVAVSALALVTSALVTVSWGSQAEPWGFLSPLSPISPWGRPEDRSGPDTPDTLPEEEGPRAGEAQTQTAALLDQVDALLADVDEVTAGLDPLDEETLTLAAELCEGDAAASTLVSALKRNQETVAGLLNDLQTATERIRERTQALQASRTSLGDRTLESLRDTIESTWTSRRALRETAGDIGREVEELTDDYQHHNWAGVLSHARTIRAIQEVRIEELGRLKKDLESISALLRRANPG
jgi:chromosome segregation ATPase